MKSVLNGPSLQYHITKKLKKIFNAERAGGPMKSNITGMDLSFQYRSRRSISLRKKNLA